MIFIAASIVSQLRSTIFFSAISRTCSLVTLPTKPRPGVLAPEAGFLPILRFAAFLRKKVTGGWRISNVKERSWEGVITTGIGAPFSNCAVRALNALQNSMMLRPRWPSAGPIGGDGLAAPAGTCNFRKPVTFFAMSHSLRRRLHASAGFVVRAGTLGRRPGSFHNDRAICSDDRQGSIAA